MHYDPNMAGLICTIDKVFVSTLHHYCMIGESSKGDLSHVVVLCILCIIHNHE